MVALRFDTFSYRFAEEILNAKLGVKNEILDIVKSIPTPTEKARAEEINSFLDAEFGKRGWDIHPAALPDLGLIADFRKERVQIEVQLSNIARYYADILKFQLSFLDDTIDIGVEIVPKLELAKEIGSNLANFERICREIVHFKSAITLPVFVIGLER